MSSKAKSISRDSTFKTQNKRASIPDDADDLLDLGWELGQIRVHAVCVLLLLLQLLSLKQGYSPISLFNY